MSFTEKDYICKFKTQPPLFLKHIAGSVFAPNVFKYTSALGQGTNITPKIDLI